MGNAVAVVNVIVAILDCRPATRSAAATVREVVEVVTAPAHVVWAWTELTATPSSTTIRATHVFIG